MREIKPILTIGYPMIDSLSEDALIEIKNNLKKEIGDDYYVLIYDYNGDNVKFECFYDKSFNETNYIELKKSLEKRINVKTA